MLTLNYNPMETVLTRLSPGRYAVIGGRVTVYLCRDSVEKEYTVYDAGTGVDIPHHVNGYWHGAEALDKGAALNRITDHA